MKEVFDHISPRWGLEEGVGIIFYQYSAPLGQKSGMTPLGRDCSKKCGISKS
jgi:hypothetical protein